MSQAPFRILIADDEPLALDLLRTLLDQTPGAVVIGAAEDGDQVLTETARLEPDAVILDINMPGRTGLQAALAMAGPRRPEMIFLTAHAHHAVEAFELDAADYLLKPVRLERLGEALDRARRQRAARAPAAAAGAAAEKEFWAPGRKGMIRVPVSAVRWIEAAKDHVFLHTESQTHMLRTTMAALEAKLEGSGLERVHRSIFVRLDAVKEIRRSRKAVNLMLDDGVLVPVGPNYVAALAARLGPTRAP